MRLEPGISEAEWASRDAQMMLGAIRDDIRQTLRIAWLDPGLEAASQEPVFFASAWSAIRPSVGRSFLALVRRLRDQAAESAASLGGRAPLTGHVEPPLTDEETARIGEAARAAHLAAAKAQIVLHLFVRAARRERIRGTGQEEPPARRGVPEWQRWLAVLPTPDPAHEALVRAQERFGTPEVPPALKPFARWPQVLDALWGELSPKVGSSKWRRGCAVVRRSMLASLDVLPHPVELQWAALYERGFDEPARRQMVEALEAHDTSAAGQTLAAAFAWRAFGAPDLGQEA